MRDMPDKEVADQKAVRDWDAYQTYRNDSQDWRVDRDKYEKFYFGNQHSASEGARMEGNQQSDIVINKIRPLLRMRVSMMIANKPTGNLLGVHKEDTGTAALLNDFADWHMYNSDWQFQLERAVMGQNRVGIHWLLLHDDPVADYGRGELKVGNESYRYVFVDKAAGTKWDFSDAPRIIVTKQRRPEDWLLSLPEKIRKTISDDDLEALIMPDDEIRWSGERQHRKSDDIGTPETITPTDMPMDKGQWIREMDIYERVMRDVPVAFAADGVMYVVGDPDDGWGSREDIKQAIADKTLTEREISQPRIKYRKNISGKMLLPLRGDDLKRKEDILPIETFPVVPIVDEDTGNALSLGEVDFQAGIQEIVNASISLTLLNASLSSNMKLFVDAGKAGITDLKKFEKRLAVPGGVHNLKTDPVTGEFPVKEFTPQPLANAWFTLAQALMHEIEFQISTFSIRSGDPTNAPSTFAATLQLGQWAQDILRIPLSRLELALERIYNLIFQWAPSYYTFEKLFYTFGQDGEPLSHNINFMTLQHLKARYRIRAGSTLPSQTVAELGILQELAQVQPALIGSVVDRMPGLRDQEKVEIKQTVDMVAQLQQSDAQKQDLIGVLQQQLQHLNEQVFALQRDQALNPLKREVDKHVNLLKETRKNVEKVNGRQPKSRRK